MRSLMVVAALAAASCRSPEEAAEPVQTSAAAAVSSGAPVVAPKSSDGAPPITVQQVESRAGSGEAGSDILIKALGTEPFWAVNVMLGRLTYSTPESPEWTVVTTQLTEQGDTLRYSGKLDGKDFILIISKGTCSDGMSDTIYPLTAKLTIGAEVRQGCARPN
ncbi:MAG: hypothetical protein J0M19_03675 [Sphingomonadales bacterium]|nr:hypothetical protein [Sphingomonadales bacterium]